MWGKDYDGEAVGSALFLSFWHFSLSFSERFELNYYNCTLNKTHVRRSKSSNRRLRWGEKGLCCSTHWILKRKFFLQNSLYVVFVVFCFQIYITFIFTHAHTHTHIHTTVVFHSLHSSGSRWKSSFVDGLYPVTIFRLTKKCSFRWETSHVNVRFPAKMLSALNGAIFVRVLLQAAIPAVKRHFTPAPLVCLFLFQVHDDALTGFSLRFSLRLLI